jgi:uncharacterized protein (DUF1800 family)
MEEASRFLAQATLGAPIEEIERVEAIGIESWLDEQLAMPASSHLEAMQRLRDRYGDFADEDTLRSPAFRRFAWWDRVMGAPDLLRQRVALALSEIFVISELQDRLYIRPEAVASFYDLLLEHAFGSYEALLLDVSLHPAMGAYLSHLNNDRSDPAIGRYPDENYAREIMQLFSIGLFELEPDGRVIEDAQGQPIPTYGNEEITELAKVFTGLGLRGLGSAFGRDLGDWTRPMRMFESHHEPGPKRLLGGHTIPDGQPGMDDVEDAVAHLAAHPNVGPFLATRLIQRLVRSNPSPAYVGRVAAVFDDDGRGNRGQLGAVVRAILTDEEARGPHAEREGGRLREPFLRWVSLLRAFDASSASGEFLVEGGPVGFLLQQHPMASPSVFNFFRPDFAPNGPIQQAGLVAPEFQITTDASIVWLVNLMTYFAFEAPAFAADVDFFRPGTIDADEIPLALDLSDEIALADDVDALIERLELILGYGTLSDESRRRIADALDPIEPALRVPMALHLVLVSPDYAVVD